MTPTRQEQRTRNTKNETSVIFVASTLWPLWRVFAKPVVSGRAVDSAGQEIPGVSVTAIVGPARTESGHKGHEESATQDTEITKG